MDCIKNADDEENDSTAWENNRRQNEVNNNNNLPLDLDPKDFVYIIKQLN